MTLACLPVGSRPGGSPSRHCYEPIYFGSGSPSGCGKGERSGLRIALAPATLVVVPNNLLGPPTTRPRPLYPPLYHRRTAGLPDCLLLVCEHAITKPSIVRDNALSLIVWLRSTLQPSHPSCCKAAIDIRHYFSVKYSRQIYQRRSNYVYCARCYK